MKKLSLILFFLPLISYGQIDTLGTNFPMKDNEVVYEFIFNSNGAKKSEIYAASKKWISDKFNNSKSVIQSEDENTGQIIGKGQTLIWSKDLKGKTEAGYELSFSIQIDARDDKFRIKFYSIQKLTQGIGMIPPSSMNILLFQDLQLKNKNKDKWFRLVKTTNNYFHSFAVDFSKNIYKSKNDSF